MAIETAYIRTAPTSSQSLRFRFTVLGIFTHARDRVGSRYTPPRVDRRDGGVIIGTRRPALFEDLAACHGEALPVLSFIVMRGGLPRPSLGHTSQAVSHHG